MFAVNGVSLDNDSYDWRVMSSTRRRSALSRDLASLRAAGRDGVVAGIASTVDASVLVVEVETPTSALESLLALVADAGTVAEGSREAVYETVATPAEDMETAVARTSVSISLRLPGVYWRDKTTSTDEVELTGASHTLDVFSGLSAPVGDSVIRLKGAANGVRVTDSSGAWMSFPVATASEYLRFDSLTGRCFRTTSDTWSGGTDISGLVDFGGPRGGFEITPSLTALNPTSRRGRLTVMSASRSGAVLAVRGRAAYLL